MFLNRKPPPVDRERQSDRQTDSSKLTHAQTQQTRNGNWQTDTHTKRQTDRQFETDRHKDPETDRRIERLKHCLKTSANRYTLLFCTQIRIVNSKKSQPFFTTPNPNQYANNVTTQLATCIYGPSPTPSLTSLKHENKRNNIAPMHPNELLPRVTEKSPTMLSYKTKQNRFEEMNAQFNLCVWNGLCCKFCQFN